MAGPAGRLRGRKPPSLSPPGKGRKKSPPYGKKYLTNIKKFGKIHIEKKRKELMENDDLV
jgi:hypothetical protein